MTGVVNNCKYHPLSPASWHCVGCHSLHCDDCVDEGERHAPAVCFRCGRDVESLGAVNSAEPFWRRLQQSFRYPLKFDPLLLIVAVSILSALLSYVPMGFILVLLLTGVEMKYYFSCLEKTAGGLLVAPDIREAYGDGLSIVISLVAIIVLLGAAVFGVQQLLGQAVAGLFAVLLIAAFPAMLIRYGISRSILEAINPLGALQLITAIGLPYGLIIAFIMIMSGSVGVLSSFIPDDYALLSTILQSMISSYYGIVMFHMLGYMIFQYQGELGFSAREDSGERRQPRSTLARARAHMDICLKEGDYAQVAKQFSWLIKQHPDDRALVSQNFEFLCGVKDQQGLKVFADNYLQTLCGAGHESLLLASYRRLLTLLPDYRPQPLAASLRVDLARACRESGEPRMAVTLVNGLHRDCPDYPRLAEAYELLADCLQQLPNMTAQAEKFRLFAQRQRQRQPKLPQQAIAAAGKLASFASATQAPVTGVAVFAARDLSPVDAAASAGDDAGNSAGSVAETPSDTPRPEGGLAPIEFS